MSPEQQKLAIAESHGWHWHTWGKDGIRVFAPQGSKPNWSGEDKATNSMVWPCEKRPAEAVATDFILRTAPDYLNDLNAIAAAVKYKITENTDFSLLKYGDYMIKKHGTHGAITASAKQHCEAFLHTINKWTES